MYVGDYGRQLYYKQERVIRHEQRWDCYTSLELIKWCQQTVISYAYNLIPEQPQKHTHRTVQRDTPQNTIDNSKRNSRKCSSNPQECQKKKIDKKQTKNPK